MSVYCYCKDRTYIMGHNLSKNLAQADQNFKLSQYSHVHQIQLTLLKMPKKHAITYYSVGVNRVPEQL